MRNGDFNRVGVFLFLENEFLILVASFLPILQAGFEHFAFV